MADVLAPEEILARIPQQEPFRFVDEILEVGDDRAVGTYRWRPESEFYRGHFPGNPVTPGVLLLECMAQCSVVPMAIHLFHREGLAGALTTFFTDAEVEFSGQVRPGTRVRVESSKIYFRRRKLKVEARMTVEDGTLVCSGQLAGVGVVT